MVYAVLTIMCSRVRIVHAGRSSKLDCYIVLCILILKHPSNLNFTYEQCFSCDKLTYVKGFNIIGCGAVESCDSGQSYDDVDKPAPLA